uniref:Uncharacterized protein n=1 Tax=Trypanosoma vivax (strain Y486) TaxID=1055687 RepID=G0U4P9_TRYVY|nr:conserved hypothetical protein [Trypanosoma vivax Y486]
MKGVEVPRVPELLARLPPTEHAILLNRFKFLNLVQRVAAADVAEMIDMVGLEALTYKGALNNVPLPFSSMHVGVGGRNEHVPIAERAAGGSASRRTPHQVAVIEKAPTMAQKRRFSTRESEKQMVERLSRPLGRRDPFDAYLKGPLRRQSEVEASPIYHEPSTQQRIRGTRSGSNIAVERNTRTENHIDDDHFYDDDVVVDSGDERMPDAHDEHISGGPVYEKRLQRSGSVRAERNARAMVVVQSPNSDHDPSTRDLHKVVRVIEGPVPKETAGYPVQVGDSSTIPRVSGIGEGVDDHNGLVDGQSPTSAFTPRVLSAATQRARGSLVPKAKPKAAAEVTRVSMGAMNRSSVAFANKYGVGPVHQGNSSQDLASIRQSILVDGNLTSSNNLASGGGSYGQIETPQKAPNEGAEESDTRFAQNGQDLARLLSDGALTELSSCVDRMLQDFRIVLDGIVGNDRSALTGTASVERQVKKEELDVVRDADGLKLARIVEKSNDLLDDLSDAEDELLLVSRLGGRIGAINRDISVIAEREYKNHERTSEEEQENERLAAIAADSTARRESKSGMRRFNTGSTGRSRRPGELPRAIVERLRSFQKENHDYIRYTERQWNTSHITEQVFAHRLTESLLDDVLREVFEEVGETLDTYVEGLVQHELQ